MPQTPKLILVDMDGTVTNFEMGFLELWKEKYPEKGYVPLEQRTTFSIRDQYPPEDSILVDEIYNAPGFFYSLKPLDGSIGALEEMAAHHNVFLCTSPLPGVRSCMGEKHDWVNKYLGNVWTKKMIITFDKTLVLGNVLIDDKPVVSGLISPKWEHILYDQPYNKQINKRRLTWKNWKAVLYERKE